MVPGLAGSTQSASFQGLGKEGCGVLLPALTWCLESSSPRSGSAGGLSDSWSLLVSGAGGKVVCHSLHEHGSDPSRVMAGQWLTLWV